MNFSFSFFIVLKSIMHSVKFLACFSKTRLKSHSINLIYDITHILGIYFSWNGKLTLEKNFLNHIVKIQNILKSWKLRDAGRVILFKSMRLLLTKIQMEFISKGKNPKIKSSTLFNDYENGGLKEIYILLMNLIKTITLGKLYWKILSVLQPSY